jgi:hypothetical protein
MPIHKTTVPDTEDGQPDETLSSPGRNSPSVTPKDVSSQDASSKDVVQRKTTSTDLEEREQAMLDDAVEMTFPASDPIAVPSSASKKGRQDTSRR